MRVFLLFLLSWMAIPAADKPDARRPSTPKPAAPPASSVSRAWPIASIRIEGNRNYSEEQVLRAAGISTGQAAGKVELDAARDRLLNTGAFQTVGYRFEPQGSGIAVTFEVAEISQVFPYRFEALEIDQRAFADWMKNRDPLFGVKLPATEAVLKRYAQAVGEFLAAAGKREEVTARLAPESGDQLVIVFRPANLPSVAEVRFRGNQIIDERTLQRAVSGAGVGALYTEARFQQVLDNSVRPLYEAKGKIRVAFPKLTTEPAQDVKGLAVTVEVREGETYQLGKVDLAGEGASPSLLKEGRFKTGETADFNEVQAGIERMIQRLRRSGYLNARARPERRVDDAAKRVDVTLHLDPGPRYTFGKLTIEGLDIQTEPHIRKLWGLKPGDPFDAAYAEYFLQQLRERDLFENLGTTRPSVKLDDQSRTADVTLLFASDGKPLPRIGPGAEKDRKQRTPWE
ncbi:MAG: FtsQ-type POTRA domain-containing protein [Acidobacteria bacterium]|nr:FtsQ-type POTRA domain-containing protein [Acidobacteriota bacterium]MBI3282196.1 FtsQ-type POTRA domain-containing protein [Acidobacteriota bacterium]